MSKLTVFKRLRLHCRNGLNNFWNEYNHSDKLKDMDYNDIINVQYYYIMKQLKCDKEAHNLGVLYGLHAECPRSIDLALEIILK